MSDFMPPGPIRLWADHHMDDVELVELPAGAAAVFSARAPGKTGPNEDSLLVAPLPKGAAVLAVADGAGGMRAGHRASRLTLECLAAELRALESDDDVRRGVLNGFERAHREVVDLGLGAATTLAGIQLDGLAARSFHAGDSMVVIMGQRGRRKLQTLPHSPVGYAVEAGLLDEHEAIRHENLHVVSNLVGVGDARIDVSAAVQLARKDTVVIASDGLFDNLLVAEVVARLRKGDLLQAARELVAEAIQRMIAPASGQPSKPDDLGVIVYRPR